MVIYLEKILQLEEHFFYNNVKINQYKEINNYERGMENGGMAGY